MTISEEIFTRHCDSLFNRPSVSEELPGITQPRDPVESLGALPTLEEVGDAVNNLKLGTAPGESGLCPEVLTYGGWRIGKSFGLGGGDFLSFSESVVETNLGLEGSTTV